MRRESPEARRRLEALWLLIMLAAGALFVRLFQLQVLERAKLGEEAERNRTETIYQTAPRGSIYDRDGVLLATNAPTFSLIYLPSHKGLSDLRPLARELAAQVGGTPREMLKSLEEATRQDTVVRLAENLPPRVMFRLSELKTLYPGVDLVVEAKRYYPHGSLASPLIGYMGRMDPTSWRRLKYQGYRIDSYIGKMGVEKQLESVLRGQDGGRLMEVDAQGRLKRELGRIPWQVGSSVYLTINAKIQQVAEQGLRHSISKKGAVVVLNPQNGAILALASEPSFDPNSFLASELPGTPQPQASPTEFDRAIAGTYAPGSTFKLVVGAAGLNEGRFTVKDSVFCPGYIKIGGREFHCWIWKEEHRGHGRMTWWTGLAQSCDVYFWSMGLRTGAGLIERYARMFGLGQLTHIALSGESPGRLVGPQTAEEEHRPWYDGDTANLSIGQGGLLVTPIQMANVAAAIANGGTLWRPHYTKRIVYADGRPPYVQRPQVLGKIDLKPSTWYDLQEAMKLVVSSGSGRGAAIAGLDVRGKTGTAQNPHGRDHSWFIAYASRPGEPPSVAMAVLVENGGFGDVSAVPIARRILLAAFGLERKPIRLAPQAPARGSPPASGGALSPPVRTL